MVNGHEIEFSGNCDAAAERLGGYERIRQTLIPILDSLSRHPEGFEKIGLDWNANRMIITEPIDTVPALVWLFYIKIGGKVVIDHVEEYGEYLFSPDYL